MESQARTDPSVPRRIEGMASRQAGLSATWTVGDGFDFIDGAENRVMRQERGERYCTEEA
jgi:hypothetical protein